MPEFRLRRALVCLALAVLIGPTLQAAMIQKMDLPDLCENGDRIAAITLINAEPGTVTLGGADFPVIHYTGKVDEAFQGNFTQKGDDQMLEWTTLGNIKSSTNGGIKSMSPLPQMPLLEVGGQYVVILSTPSAAGLSTTVGLGQGCFTISNQGKGATVTDGLGNSMSYAALAAELHSAAQ